MARWGASRDGLGDEIAKPTERWSSLQIGALQQFDDSEYNAGPSLINHT